MVVWLDSVPPLVMFLLASSEFSFCAATMVKFDESSFPLRILACTSLLVVDIAVIF